MNIEPYDGLKEPSPATLRKYGWTRLDWIGQVMKQGGVCAVCSRLPPNKRLVIDHEHVKGWKKKPPHLRKLYVRGLLCNWCNYNFLRRGMTMEMANNVFNYLHNYERDSFMGVDRTKAVKIAPQWAELAREQNSQPEPWPNNKPDYDGFRP